ncbi:hypothetical protein EGH21_19635 [Halomicroarcula sp. F13]|uniref:Uncharacterized protein n=1 Tax=Haloarcula rubra TaxID=2487747 RepID=A0AAW4PY83_9EURY|nr:hypothetical protein [Halomicroarcula rubra]MBX0325242.1 hypothetical protein [Halomicroarcula rubra]
MSNEDTQLARTSSLDSFEDVLVRLGGSSEALIIDSAADRAARIVDMDIRQSASSAFDRWLAKYGAEWREFHGRRRYRRFLLRIGCRDAGPERAHQRSGCGYSRYTAHSSRAD